MMLDMKSVNLQFNTLGRLDKNETKEFLVP